MRATLPDGTLACVAVGDAVPAAMSLGRLELRGEALRFARIRPDLSKISALGVTCLDQVAACAAPGTVQLERLADGEARVTTDVGMTLAEAWLGRPMRQAYVQALDGGWQDVTSECGAYELPAALVRQWSQRNQRTLVEFKVVA
jgi:hypothetical protein